MLYSSKFTIFESMLWGWTIFWLLADDEISNADEHEGDGGMGDLMFLFV